jgi:hypothetical protein
LFSTCVIAEGVVVAFIAAALLTDCRRRRNEVVSDAVTQHVPDTLRLRLSCSRAKKKERKE